MQRGIQNTSKVINVKYHQNLAGGWGKNESVPVIKSILVNLCIHHEIFSHSFAYRIQAEHLSVTGKHMCTTN